MNLNRGSWRSGWRRNRISTRAGAVVGRAQNPRRLTTVVSSATGLSRTTVIAGPQEIETGVCELSRIRRAGAGRPKPEGDQPGVKAALETLVDPLTRGDPCSPLRWARKSRAKVTAALVKQGWRVSSTTVGRLLHELGYSRQSMRQTREDASHPERNAQAG